VGPIVARVVYQIKGRDADMGCDAFTSHPLVVAGTRGRWHCYGSSNLPNDYNEGLRYIVSGGNAMRMRACMEELLPLILTEIDLNDDSNTGQGKALPSSPNLSPMTRHFPK